MINNANKYNDKLAKRQDAAFNRVRKLARAKGYVPHWKMGKFCTESERKRIIFRRMFFHRICLTGIAISICICLSCGLRGAQCYLIYNNLPYNKLVDIILPDRCNAYADFAKLYSTILN